MPVYTVIAKRETLYELEIRAESEAEAIEEVSRIELNEDIEEYAYDWYPVEIEEINEIEDKD
jgi:hypothetical protein